MEGRRSRAGRGRGSSLTLGKTEKMNLSRIDASTYADITAGPVRMADATIRKGRGSVPAMCQEGPSVVPGESLGIPKILRGSSWEGANERSGFSLAQAWIRVAAIASGFPNQMAQQGARANDHGCH